MIANFYLKSKSDNKKYNLVHDKQTGKKYYFFAGLILLFQLTYVAFNCISYYIQRHISCDNIGFYVQQNKDFVVHKIL